jgi:hypothetical protein
MFFVQYLGVTAGIEPTCVDGRRNKEQWGLGIGTKNGAVDLSLGLQMEVCFFVQSVTISRKRVNFFRFINTTLAINIMKVFALMSKNIFFSLQFKKRPCDGESEYAFILGSTVCTVVNSTK